MYAREMQCPSLGKEKNKIYFEHFLTDPVCGPKYCFLCSEFHKVLCENSPLISAWKLPPLRDQKTSWYRTKCG